MVDVDEPTVADRVRVASPGQFRGLGDIAHKMVDLTPGLIAYNLGYLLLSWAIAIGSIAVCWAYPSWYTFVLAFLVVSSRQQALLNIEHEAIHRKLVPSARWNEFVGRYLCAAPVGSPFGASQARHLAHHRLLGTPEDPDHDLHAGDEKRTRKGLARHFLGALVGGYAGMVLMGPRTPQAPSSSANAKRDLVSLVLLQMLLGVGLTLILSWWVYLALWLAPLATVTVLFHLVRSFVEHAITATEESRHSNRLITIRSNLVERGLVAPYSMNYHAEHHLLPSVPAPRLRRLKLRLAERDETPPVLERTSYGAALIRYVRALRG